MLNQAYRLVAPRQFEVQTVAEEITNNDIIVRPRFLSVCHADTRYFTGQRPQATTSDLTAEITNGAHSRRRW